MTNAALLLSSVFVYLISPVSYARNDTDLLLNLTLCSIISSDDARLICFDKLTPNRAKQSIVASTVVVPSTVDSKSAEQKQVDDFAKAHLKKTKDKEAPSSIVATVSKVEQLLRGQWVVYLENGQKWQQTDTTNIKLNVGSKVRLNKAAMGAIYLYKEGSHRRIKVKRLK